MKLEFSDSRNWKYIFTVGERSRFINITYIDHTNTQICCEDVAIFDDHFNWRPYHNRLLGKEAKEFCETKLKQYLDLKAFW